MKAFFSCFNKHLSMQNQMRRKLKEIKTLSDLISNSFVWDLGYKKKSLVVYYTGEEKYAPPHTSYSMINDALIKVPNRTLITAHSRVKFEPHIPLFKSDSQYYHVKVEDDEGKLFTFDFLLMINARNKGFYLINSPLVFEEEALTN